MEKLNNYLETHVYEKTEEVKEEFIRNDKKHSNSCCQDENNIFLSPDLLVYVCEKCGRVQQDELYTKDNFDSFKNPLIVKTFIGRTSNKYRHLQRLNRWSTWKYNENEIHKMKEYIQKMEIIHKDSQNIKRIAKIKLKEFYIDQKVVTRNNIRRALYVYCVIFAYNYLGYKFDFDYLCKIADITKNHFVSVLNKLKKMKLLSKFDS